MWIKIVLIPHGSYIGIKHNGTIKTIAMARNEDGLDLQNAQRLGETRYIYCYRSLISGLQQRLVSPVEKYLASNSMGPML